MVTSIINLKIPNENWKKNKPLYIPVKSSNSKKKGMVYVIKNDKKRLIYFGDSSMEDFTQHKDKERRKNLTKNNKNSANYYSRKYLWNA